MCLFRSVMVTLWNFTGKSHPWTNASVRGKLWKNFQDHWSIRSSPGKGMDQWRSKFSESFSLDYAVLVHRVTISTGWYRIRKPLKLEIRKRYELITKSPIPGWGLKIRKKYRKNTEKIQERSFLGHFRTFSVFISYFRAQPEIGDFVICSFFFVFPVLRGFHILYRPVEIATIECSSLL